MTKLTDRQAELCETSTTDYSDLNAFFINCTLKRGPERSHTQGLMDISMEIMRRNGVRVDGIRAIDHVIATGVWPDYLDDGSGGPENDFTNRNTTFATWNLLHMARMLKDAGGIPAHGNQRSEWDAGARFDFPNPEHR